jgi:FkbM family methyltransferase
MLAGRYEPEKADAFVQNVESGAFIIDVGAHYGYFSLIAAQLVRPKGVVWAFEPRPSNLRVLRVNLRANGATNVTVWEQAVGAGGGSGRFDARHGSGTGRLSQRGGITVSVVAMDDLPLPRPPSLIKVDVEGGEVEVLSGATRTIEEYRPKLLIAVHGEKRQRQVEEMLSDWRYHFSTINPQAVKGDREILAIPDSLRIFSS